MVAKAARNHQVDHNVKERDKHLTKVSLFQNLNLQRTAQLPW